MDIVSETNASKLVGTFRHMLKLVLLISIFVSLALYVLALPLGLELFLFERLSTSYSSVSPISINLFYSQFEVSLGFAFTFLIVVYVLCFISASIRSHNLFKRARRSLLEPTILPVKSFLLALPILSSLTYTVVVCIHFLEQLYGTPIGKPPLPEDTLLAYYGLSASPLTEELVYRILPIGVFLAVYLLNLSKQKEPSTSWKERLRICLLSFLKPDDAKKKLGLKTVSGSGLFRGINRDEWVMVLFTSVFFAVSHYFPPSTWMAGKIASTFIQGLVMSLSFLAYGFEAPILIHWFFNFCPYTYGLAATMHPSMASLSLLNDKSTLILGTLGLIIAVFSTVRGLKKTGIRGFRTSLSLAAKIKDEILVRRRNIKSCIHRLEFLDLAALILTLSFFCIRLAIVYSPRPESGDRYFDTGFIFDESYYVKAARKMLVGEASNNEHPPLSKALIMLGIALFGDNPLGWRIFPIISSSISIALAYRFWFLLCHNKLASFIAALLFATDVMAFNIGQIAMLDAPCMVFILLGSTLLLTKRYNLSGLFFGLASLCKLTAIFTLAGMALFQVLSSSLGHYKDRKPLKDLILPAGRIVIIAFVTFLIGLWIYDSTYGVFGNNPLGHIIFMFNYHNSLRYQNPQEVILPLQWINPFDPFSCSFYELTVQETVNGIVREYHPIAYYGRSTPLWLSIWIAVPVCLIEAIRKDRQKDRKVIGLFSFIWIAANFFPFVLFAYLMQRWVYPFYFCMTLPGLYICLSFYLARTKPSKILLVFLTCEHLLWFFIWFPVKPKVISDFLLSLGLPA